MIIYRAARWLDEKNIIPAHIVPNFNAYFTITEGVAQDWRQNTTQMIADSMGKGRIGRTGEYFKITVHVRISK
jgi:hypothetical protein